MLANPLRDRMFHIIVMGGIGLVSYGAPGYGSVGPEAASGADDDAATPSTTTPGASGDGRNAAEGVDV